MLPQWRATFCGTKDEKRLKVLKSSVAISIPSRRIRPEVGRRKPMIRLIRVLLPRRPSHHGQGFPRRTSRFTSDTAGAAGPDR